jgi:hypothetical protein
MTDLELIFVMLGEASTTEIADNKNAQGFLQNKKAAKEGGSVAGKGHIGIVTSRDGGFINTIEGNRQW